MTILFIVAHRGAGDYLRGFSAACRRKKVEFSIFFTGDGVRVLSDSAVVACAGSAAEAVVCEHSWSQAMPGGSLPADPWQPDRPQPDAGVRGPSGLAVNGIAAKSVLVVARRDPLEAMRVAAGITVFGHDVALVFAHGRLEVVPKWSSSPN